jgi:ABC-2 type transport system permease protein
MSAANVSATAAMEEPTLIPNGGRVGLVMRSVRVELRGHVRTPEFAVGVVLVPLLLYVMFGLPNDWVLDGGVPYRAAALVSLSAYGVVSLAIFNFGEAIARDRSRGWLRTIRATPISSETYLLSKLVAALLLAVVIVAGMSGLASAGGVRLDAGTWVVFVATMLAGVVLFSTLGCAIAFIARPRAASAVANLVFLPLSFVSGFFVPLSEVPPIVRTIAPFLPTFHFGQIAYRVVMPTEAVEELTGMDQQPLAVHVIWVVGAAIVMGCFALWAARREAATGRG